MLASTSPAAPTPISASTMEILDDPPAHPSSKVGPYRRRDFLRLPEEPRCELIEGRFYRMAAPQTIHQVVALVLWRHLDAVALRHAGLALGAPLAITLAAHTVVQPDVVYLDRRARRSEIAGHIDGIPDLAVEVLSPSSDWRDREVKRRLYAEAGVPEYWIVDPVERRMEFLILDSPAGDPAAYRAVAPIRGVHRSPVLPALTLALAAFWRKVDLRIA